MKQVIPFSKEIVFKTNIGSITSISLEHEEKIKEGEIVGDFIVFGDYKIHNDTTEKELFKYRLPFTALIPDNILQSTINIDVQDFTYDQINDNTLRVDIDFYLEGEEIDPDELEVDAEEIDRNELLDNELEKEESEIETLDEEPQNDVEFLDVDVSFDREIDELINKSKSEEEKIVEESTKEVKTIEPEEIRGNVMMNEILEEEPKMEVQIEEPKMEVKAETKTTTEEIEKNVEVETKTEVEQTNKDEKTTEIKEEYVTYHVHIVKAEETLENILKLYGTSIDDIKDYNDLTNIEIGQKIIIPEYIDE